MDITFTPEELQQVELHKSKYPEPKAAIMPVLWMAQKKWGWLSEDVMRYIGQLLDLPTAHVKGVATFYTMYFKKPMGNYHIQVCTNISCMLRGGEDMCPVNTASLIIKEHPTVSTLSKKWNVWELAVGHQ